MIHQPDLVRPAVSAGRYYPAYRDELRDWLRALFDAAPANQGDLPVAILAPHGDQSGFAHIAAAAYSALQGVSCDRVIVCAPSHHDRFTNASVFSGRAYETPLGLIPVDMAFCDRLCTSCRVAMRGDLAHWPSREYSLEVQLPFLQYTLGNFSLVPIVMGETDEAAARALGEGIARIISESEGRTLIVATSDLSHFHGERSARRMDARTIDAIRGGDVHGFLEGIRIGDFEACGAGPIATVLEAALRLGAKAESDPTYDTSLAATNDPVSVVGYASVVFRAAA